MVVLAPGRRPWRTPPLAAGRRWTVGTPSDRRAASRRHLRCVGNPSGGWSSTAGVAPPGQERRAGATRRVVCARGGRPSARGYRRVGSAAHARCQATRGATEPPPFARGGCSARRRWPHVDAPNVPPSLPDHDASPDFANVRAVLRHRRRCHLVRGKCAEFMAKAEQNRTSPGAGQERRRASSSSAWRSCAAAATPRRLRCSSGWTP